VNSHRINRTGNGRRPASVSSVHLRRVLAAPRPVAFAGVIGRHLQVRGPGSGREVGGRSGCAARRSFHSRPVQRRTRGRLARRPADGATNAGVPSWLPACGRLPSQKPAPHPGPHRAIGEDSRISLWRTTPPCSAPATPVSPTRPCSTRRRPIHGWHT